MAIYAPITTIGNGSHKQVASLVKANEGNAASELSSISIDGTSYKVKSSGIDSLAGRDGTIPYLGRLESSNNYGYSPETLFRQDVFICENEEDYDRSKNSTVTMKQVFQSWIKGGYLNNRWLGYDQEYYKSHNYNIGNINLWLERNKNSGHQPQTYSQLENATAENLGTFLEPPDQYNGIQTGQYGAPYWFYSNGISSIVQACNVSDSSFYISPMSISQYDITVKCWSNHSDDAFIGLILASVIDNDTKRPTNLIVGRSPNNSNTEDYGAIFYHFFLTSDCIWPKSSPNTIASKYRISELSGSFLNGRPSYTSRFVKLSAGASTYVPRMNSSGNWDRPSIDHINAYNSNPMPYEKLYKNELYQVNYPLDYNNYLISGGNWSTKTTTIDINNLSAPENWWWMNDNQWNKLYSESSKPNSWKNAGHSYLRIRRDGNMISAWATKFTGTPPNNDVNLKGDTNGTGKLPSNWDTAVANKDAYLISVNLNSSDKLNNVPINKWSLAKHPEGGQIGFVTQSQPFATWDIIEMNIPQVFVKTWTNELIEYNPLTKEYKAITDKLPADYCGRGRLCKNLVTGKTFYVGDTHFERIS